MRGNVVDDRVDQFSSWNVSLQSIQEVEELLMPMALHVAPEDFTG
jgi:hypothetical protein